MIFLSLFKNFTCRKRTGSRAKEKINREYYFSKRIKYKPGSISIPTFSNKQGLPNRIEFSSVRK